MTRRPNLTELVDGNLLIAQQCANTTEINGYYSNAQQAVQQRRGSTTPPPPCTLRNAAAHTQNTAAVSGSGSLAANLPPPLQQSSQSRWSDDGGLGVMSRGCMSSFEAESNPSLLPLPPASLPSPNRFADSSASTFARSSAKSVLEYLRDGKTAWSS